MSIDERGRRAAAGGRRRGDGVPRSGGRSAEQGRSARNDTSSARGAGTAAPGARRFATQGSAALTLEGPVRVTAAEPPRGTPQLRVAPPAPIRVPRARFVALVVALVVAGVFGILLINTKTNENAFTIAGLQEQQAALDNEKQQLNKQIAAYEHPGNLRAAAHRLGLVEARNYNYIRLPDGKIIGALIPPDGKPAITAQDNGR